MTVKPSPEELDLLLGLPFVQRASYIGRYGWISVTVGDQSSLKLALELVDETYERIVASQTRGASTRRPRGTRTRKGRR